MPHHIFYLTSTEIVSAVVSVGAVGTAYVRNRIKKNRMQKISRHTAVGTKVNVRNAEALKKLKDAMDKFRRNSH